VGQTIILCRLPSRKSGRVEKPAEIEEHKSHPKREHSAKSAANADRFFMKFRGPQALPNRPQKAMVCPTPRYLIATVIPAWLLAIPPNDKNSGAAPEATPSGTTTLTCSAPATKPGAAPMY